MSRYHHWYSIFSRLKGGGGFVESHLYRTAAVQSQKSPSVLFIVILCFANSVEGDTDRETIRTLNATKLKKKISLREHLMQSLSVSRSLDLACRNDPLHDVLATGIATPQHIYQMNQTGFGIGINKCSRILNDQRCPLGTCYQTHR